MLREEAQRLLTIITQLLDRYRHGRHMELHRETLDAGALLEQAAASNRQQARAKDITIMTATPAGLTVDADASAMHRVLDNLVSNAVKFSPQGSKVYLDAHQQGPYVRFQVRDEGPGLTRDDERLVFQRLAQLSARPTHQEVSTGLGLYIVKRLVEAHGGRVGVDSTPQRGAIFWIDLPATVPPA